MDRSQPIDSPAISAMLWLRPNYMIVPKNGQRHYGPPIDYPYARPPESTEVYVSQLPDDCYEDELVPVFESFGAIYQLRLVMHFTGLTKQFCFVRYTNALDAQNAIRKLDGYHIRPGHPIKIVLSKDRRFIQIENIPKHITQFDVIAWTATNGLSDGLRSVSLNSNGLAFIGYDSHYSASMARRAFVKKGMLMWNNRVTCKWLDYNPRAVADNVRSLCIRYLDSLIECQSNDKSEEILKTIFSAQYLPIEKVTIVAPESGVRPIAFLRYTTRLVADLALKHFAPLAKIYGFQISWAHYEV